MEKIDSHHHLWTLSRGDYAWLSPELEPIYRDFVPDDLAPRLADAGISQTVLVQATDTIAETDFMLATAAGTPWIGGVVGWVDMESRDAVATLERFAQHPKFRGIRPMIQGLSDDNWILREGLDPVFEVLIAMDLTFDALVLPRHLPMLWERLKRHPDLRCVIDHGAKPDLAGGDIDAWRKDMANIAKETDCFCKFSGLVTEAGDNPDLSHVKPAADALIELFGADRLMFGSDWPVVNMAGSYAGWHEMAQSLLGELSTHEQEKIWAGTARQFYKL